MKKIKILVSLLLGLLCASGFAQEVKVTYYSPRIVRVQKSADGKFRTKPSVSVVMAPQAKVSKPEVKATVGADGTIIFTDSKGKVLLKEGASSFKAITEGLDKGAWEISQSWALDPDEPIYGLGMLQNGKMSQRGENREMIQSNLEDFQNFFQSIKGYGVFWDNYSPTKIADDGTILSLSSQVAEDIDYYFIYGGNADGVIASVRELTGKVPMMPLWTYGYHQSRERYKSQQELLDVVKGYRAAGVPLDGIIQDWQYWGTNYTWNAMEFLNELFPRPQDMVDQVHEMNAHMSISIWQSFGPMTKPYRQLKEKDLLLEFETWPASGLSSWPPRRDYPSGVQCYDVYSAEARDIYWDNLLRLYNMGIDAWWMDSTDPDHTYREGDFDQMTAMGSFRSVRNIFPIMTAEGVYDHQRALSNDRRVFILTRSSFMGQQRIGANTWSGDTQSTWDDFRHQIPLCLNFTLTGSPHVNADIGGFFPGGYNRRGAAQTCHENPGFQELYVRWLQFGLFTPMMRSHGETSRREIWEFGKKGEPIYDAIEKAIKMRYALMPYIYSTSWQVTSNNDSFMRALIMDYAADKNVWDMNDEFMFGRSLLVAPVTQAMYMPERRAWYDEAPDWTEKKEMEVYLPAGNKWYDFATNKLYNGGANVTVDASIDHCPVFVREGSIVPIGPDVQYTSEKPWDDLVICVYAGPKGNFTLYEDEGDNYNYENGVYSTIDFTLKGRKLTIGARKGSFPGMLQNRTFRIMYIDGNTVKGQTVNYNGKAVTVSL
ncbi:MAG: DUF5110 domain-containing protein [Bacteroidales bacterium]|nr:DUF5110 domain-containing protein [Bacteroidales bacterium]